MNVTVFGATGAIGQQVTPARLRRLMKPCRASGYSFTSAGTPAASATWPGQAVTGPDGPAGQEGTTAARSGPRRWSAERLEPRVSHRPPLGTDVAGGAIVAEETRSWRVPVDSVGGHRSGAQPVELWQPR